MGNKENKSFEKDTLIDFLYKDNELINSFYAQMFGGNTTLVRKSQSANNELSADVEGNIAVVKGVVSSKKSDSQEITTTINPHDYKVIELLENLNLTNTILSKATPGTIVSTDGTLLFRDYDNLSKLIPFISQNGLVKEFNDKVSPNAQGKMGKLTLGSLIQQMFSLIPYGLEFELFNGVNESATCIIKEGGLVISKNDIIRLFGLNLPSTWTVVGIIDNTVKSGPESKNQFKNAIDSASSVFSEMILDKDLPIIRPITIYRKISID